MRLYNMTNDPGMKDMLSYLIARDTMHQQQWLAVIEELGGFQQQTPVPNSFPQQLENQQFSYVFLGFTQDGSAPPQGRWTSGPSIGGKGQFSMAPMQPLGGEPDLGPARPDSAAQTAQMAGGMQQTRMQQNPREQSQMAEAMPEMGGQ